MEVLFVHGYVVLCCLVSLFLGSWLHPQIALAWASLVDTSMGRGYTHEDQNGLCIEVNFCAVYMQSDCSVPLPI